MKYLSITFLWLCAAGLFAQEPIRVQPLAVPPYPTVFSDYLGRTNEPVLILTNTDPLNGYELMIGLEASGDNGIAVVSNARKQPLEPIRLDAGETVMLTAQELLDLYANHTPNDITYVGVDPVDVVQSQSIPEGVYTACVTAFDFNTGEPRSLPGCTPAINIRHLDPPIIVAPQDRETLLAGPPDVIRFQWTAVAGATVPIAYRFRLAELPKGVNPYDAVEDDNLLWYEEQTLVPFLYYDPTYPPLKADVEYALQITAYDEDGAVVIRNGGRSEVVTFLYAEALFEAPEMVGPTDRYLNPLEDGSIDFGWTRIGHTSIGVEYELFVYRYPEGESLVSIEKDPETFLKLATTTPATGYVWQTGKLDDYVAPGRYAARVRGTIEGAVVVGDGFSDWLFFEVVDEGGSGDFGPLEVIQKSCGDRFRIRGPQSRRPQPIAVDDQLRMHDMLLTVSEITSGGGRNYNGRAITQPTAQLPAMEVAFFNLTANKFGEVIEGQIEASYREGTALPEGWKNATTPVTTDGLNRAYMTENFSLAYENDGRFPLRLPNGLVITALRITPTASKVKLVHLGYFQGGQGPQQWRVFGRGGVDFTNAGPTARGEAALPLVESLNYREDDAYGFDLEAGNDKTLLYYDCEGINGYELFGQARATAYRALETEEGSPVAIGGFLRGRVDDISDFIVRLSFRSATGSGTFARTVVHQLMPGHPLTPDSLVLDHSYGRDRSGFVAPEGAFLSGGDHWRGLYIPSLRVALPPSLTVAESGERLERQVENFVIDRNGMSGATDERLSTAEALMANKSDYKIDFDSRFNPNANLDLSPRGFADAQVNLDRQPNIDPNRGLDSPLESSTPATETGQTLSSGGLNRLDLRLAGWPVKLQAYQLELTANELTHAYLEGHLYPRLLDEGLAFRGDMEPSTAGMNIAADVRTDGRTVSFPLWKTTAELTADSEMTLRMAPRGSANTATISVRLNGMMSVNGEYEGVGRIKIPKIRFRGLVFGNQNLGNNASFAFDYLEVLPGDNQAAGYAIRPGDIRLARGERQQQRLLVDYGFELGGPEEGIAANATLMIEGQGNYQSGYEYRSADLGEVELPPGQVGGGDVMDYEGGTVTWEDDGSGAFGFRGEFGGSLGLIGSSSFNVIAQFGRTARARNYFGLQCDVNLGGFVGIPSGIPGFDIGGFGGGIYYNMEKRDFPPGYTGTRLPLQDYYYVPRSDAQTSFGIDLNVLVHTTASPELFNGRFGLSADFVNSELTTLSLKGKAHFMEDGFGLNFWKYASEPSESAGISLFGHITWDKQGGSLFGNLGYEIGIGPNDMINGYHESAFAFRFVDDNDWYLRFGEKLSSGEYYSQNRYNFVNINFEPKLSAFGETFSVKVARLDLYLEANSGLRRGSRPKLEFFFQSGPELDFDFGVPLTQGDRIRMGGYLKYYTGGFIGYDNNNRYCARPDQFFTRAEAGLKGGFYLGYWDACDKWDIGSCGEWDNVSFDFDLAMFAYLPNPSGIGLRIDLPFLDPFYPTLGESCGW